MLKSKRVGLAGDELDFREIACAVLYVDKTARNSSLLKPFMELYCNQIWQYQASLQQIQYGLFAIQ